MKRVNSNDIAKLAGVSRSTVSRVINGYSNVPEETRQKVMNIIKKHRYYPQLSGQLLSGQLTKTIGLFWGTRSSIASDPLCSAYFMHVIDAAVARGYLVLSCVLDNLTDKENMNYVRKIFMEGRIDAGVFVGVNNNEPLIDELIELDRIVGLFGYYHANTDISNCITVNFDMNSGEQAIDYLYSLGHRKIAIVDGDLGRITSLHRHESYLRGLAKHNLTIKQKWMSYGGIVSQEGYQATKRMLEGCMDDLPTAICANNDAVAFGAYRACQELSLRIPEDISIIGADGHNNGSSTNPPLTTITYDFRRMFTSLVDRLIDVVEMKENVSQNEFIEGHLLERFSCKAMALE